MASSPVFPGTSVIISFNHVEKMLADVGQMIPYCAEHEGVWSVPLVTILLETCSQLDSLWKAEVSHSSSATTKQLNIVDYFERMGEKVAKRWVVFWGEDGERIQPYSAWAAVPNYSRASYQPLDWWQAYNNVKHDRLANRKEATLKHAVQALAGLFIAVFRCEKCAAGIAQEDWAPSPDSYSLLPEELYSDDCPILGIVAESKLLSHPIHDGGVRLRPSTGVISSRSSYRFRHWCDERGIRYI